MTIGIDDVDLTLTVSLPGPDNEDDPVPWRFDPNDQTPNLWPRPSCCCAIQRWPVVHAMADIPDDGIPRCRWAWHHFHEHPIPGYAGESLWRAPAPTHCPFCQTQLPDLVLRDPTPVTCEPADHYCVTCDERLMECGCLRLECRWEVRRTPPDGGLFEFFGGLRDGEP